MKLIVLSGSGYDKLSGSHKKCINKGIDKLISLLQTKGRYFEEDKINNPLIHDSYKNRFYMFKYVVKNFSVRILYRCDFHNDNDFTLQIHKFHFKKGDRDNSKYIEEFERYSEEFKL